MSSQVEKLLYEKNLDKEYAGIMGYESFRKAAIELALGKEDVNIKNKLVSHSLYELVGYWFLDANRCVSAAAVLSCSFCPQSV